MEEHSNRLNIRDEIIELEKKFKKQSGGMSNVRCHISWYARAGAKLDFYARLNDSKYRYIGGFGNVDVLSSDGVWYMAFFRLTNLDPCEDRIKFNLPVWNSDCCVKQYYTNNGGEIMKGLEVVVNLAAEYDEERGVCLKCTKVSLPNGQTFIKQYTSCKQGIHMRTGQFVCVQPNVCQQVCVCAANYRYNT